MKVLFNKDSDSFRLNLQDRSFEWSYFESDFSYENNKYNLVIIGFCGNPFVPSFYEKNHKPCVNIVLTQNSKVISFALFDYQSITFKNSTLSIGNTFRIEYHKDHSRNVIFSMYDLTNTKISGEILFTPSIFLNHLQNTEFGDQNDQMSWGIQAIKYSAKGSLEYKETMLKIDTSEAYHDYNSGNKDYFFTHIQEWIWFKTLSEFPTLFFALNENNITENIAITIDCENVEFKRNIGYDDIKYVSTNLGMKYPQKMVLQSPIHMSIHNKYHMDYAQNIMGFDFHGLMYTRQYFEGQNEKSKIEGTFECIRPQLLRSSWRRLLIKFGIRNGKQDKNLL